MELTLPLFVLGTNIVLYFLGGRLVNTLPSGQYFISVITELELLSYSKISYEEELRIRTFLNKMTIVGIDSNVKNLTVTLRKQYKLKLPDAIIAGSAHFLNATLFTNDTKLSSVTEIKTQALDIL